MPRSRICCRSVWTPRAGAAGPEDGGATGLESLAGKKIATKYPPTAGRFLAAHGIEAEPIPQNGVLELAPVPNLASVIIDISVSGSCLVAHDLAPLHEISLSKAVLVAHIAATTHEARSALIHRLLIRMRASLAARQYNTS